MNRVAADSREEPRPVPSYDSSRARLRLADRHIAVLAHLVDGQNPPDELWDSLLELQAAALVGAEGELSQVLAPLLGALAEPMVMVQVEVTGEHGPVNHGVVIGQEAVYSHDGWPGEEESEYTPVEPTFLVWELARKVNLRKDRVAAPERPVSRLETTMATLDAAFTALAEPSEDEAALLAATRAAVREADSSLTGDVLELFVELVASLNSHWRITTVWDGDHEGERTAMVRALAVWDAGPLGYWIREQPAEPILPGAVGPDSPLVVVASDVGEIWDKVTDLLPDKEDLHVDVAGTPNT